MRFLAATNNRGKLREIREILEEYGHECLSMAEAGIHSDPEETGETLEQNAVIKARAAAALTELPVLADDSGVLVDALGGLPGVHTGRYAGEHATDDENIDKLLDAMKDIPDGQRAARFETVAAAVIDGRLLITRGTCHGYIGRERLGVGFGYKPVFYLSAGVTLATLPEEELNRISHRGHAVRALCELLKQQAEGSGTTE